MLDAKAIFSTAVICLAGVMSPGPNFMAITHRALSSTRHEAMAMVIGIALVSMLWATTALFGLGLLFSAMPWLFWSTKLIGAAYLVWFGVRLFRRSGQPVHYSNAINKNPALHSALRSGVATNLANPKSMVFYASVFAGAVPAQSSKETLLSMVLMVGAIATIWYGSVALVLSIHRMAKIYHTRKTVIERTCALFLILLGIRQALL